MTDTNTFSCTYRIIFFYITIFYIYYNKQKEEKKILDVVSNKTYMCYYCLLRPAEFESTQIAWKATSLPLTYGRLNPPNFHIKYIINTNQ